VARRWRRRDATTLAAKPVESSSSVPGSGTVVGCGYTVTAPFVT
jgi:hypothetical protein